MQRTSERQRSDVEHVGALFVTHSCFMGHIHTYIVILQLAEISLFSVLARFLR